MDPQTERAQHGWDVFTKATAISIVVTAAVVAFVIALLTA